MNNIISNFEYDLLKRNKLLEEEKIIYAFAKLRDNRFKFIITYNYKTFDGPQQDLQDMRDHEE